MVTIINYGVGNLGSIRNMLSRIGVNSVISSVPDEIIAAEKLILPGVGNFDNGMEQLHKRNLIPLLNLKVIERQTPILGICLGAQLLSKSSEEGNSKGLGWINAKTVAFSKEKMQSNQKVPHMGWSNISDFKQSKLFSNMYEDPRFYFVHSYHLIVDEPKECMVQAEYGYSFAAGIEKGNILGVQFHPEKSHKFGMKILENFVKYY
jgi:glutamine amidotransferase